MDYQYQAGAAICPTCGSSDQVHTARELFDMMNGAREQAFQRLNQFQRPGQRRGRTGTAAMTTTTTTTSKVPTPISGATRRTRF